MPRAFTRTAFHPFPTTRPRLQRYLNPALTRRNAAVSYSNIVPSPPLTNTARDGLARER